MTDGLQKLGSQIDAKLFRVLGHRSPRSGFSADYAACRHLVKENFELWLTGRAWEILRERYKRPGLADRRRFDLETALIKELGASSDLVFRNPYYKYPDHPVVIFAAARSQQTLRHVSDSEITDAMFLYGLAASKEYDDPARGRSGDLLRQLMHTHGLFCAECKQIKDSDGINCFPLEHHSHFWWGKHGICETCATDIRVKLFNKSQRQQLAAQQFQRAMAEKRRQAREAREGQDAELKLRHVQAREARERGKIERDAAYALVQELGLLNQIRERVGASNEA